MKQDVRNYVNSCPNCQTRKSDKSKKKGLIIPLPVPERTWDEIAMDWKTGLPNNNVWRDDAIIVVVDRLNKQVHFIPYKNKDDAEKSAQRFFTEVVRLYGMS